VQRAGGRDRVARQNREGDARAGRQRTGQGWDDASGGGREGLEWGGYEHSGRAGRMSSTFH
jgi:hypothetical protein